MASLVKRNTILLIQFVGVDGGFAARRECFCATTIRSNSDSVTARPPPAKPSHRECKFDSFANEILISAKRIHSFTLIIIS